MSAEEKGGKRRFNGFEGVILGVPFKDTIKEARDGMIKKTLKRGSLWSVQTPQIFPY
jgi:2-C-methyl-D-erythritol 4-phosphate cytidylyltransferase